MSISSTFNFIVRHPLNKNRKIWAILNYIKWQMESRLRPGPKIHHWVNGSKFYARNGDLGLTGNIYVGLDEFTDMAYLLHVLRAEDLFIDIGANHGSYTLLASAAIGACTYAFEPVPADHQRLTENIQLNDLGSGVTIFNKSVGSSNGKLKITTNLGVTNHIFRGDETDSNLIDTEVVTLDSALENKHPALIKIDVEGFETEVLSGGMETLNKSSLHSAIIELNDSGLRYGYKDSDIVNLMFDLGFKAYHYHPMERRLEQISGKNSNSANTIFIRNSSLISDRIKNAPKFRIPGRNIVL